MVGSTTNVFFYRPVGGAEHGPVTVEELGRLIADKKVTAITQVRESGCLIWRYANDFSILARFFHPQPQRTAGDPLSKPLAQLTDRDLPQLVAPYLRTVTTLVFFFFYLPTTVAIIFQAAATLIGFRGIRELYAGLGIRLPHIVPMWIILAIGACIVVLCIGPLVAWIAYFRRALTWARFVLAAVGSYFLPTVGLGVLALVLQQIEITWVTGMTKQWLTLFP